MHPTKSKRMFIGSSYILTNKVCDNSVLLNDVPIPQTGTYKCLGVDESLSWSDKHIETICKKASAGIGATRRAIEPYVPVNTLQTIYKALVQPYFDYITGYGYKQNDFHFNLHYEHIIGL